MGILNGTRPESKDQIKEFLSTSFKNYGIILSDVL